MGKVINAKAYTSRAKLEAEINRAIAACEALRKDVHAYQDRCIGYQLDIRRLLEAADRVVFGHLNPDDTHGSVVSLDAVVRDIRRSYGMKE